MSDNKVVPFNESDEELNAFERRLIANGVRIEIPLKGANRMDVRELGGIIAAYGQKLVALSHDKKTLREVLMETHFASEEVKWRMLDIRQKVKGRRRKMAEEDLKSKW